MSESSLSYKGASLSGPAWAVISCVVLLVIGGLAGLAMWLDGDSGETDVDPPGVEIDTAISTIAPDADELQSAWLDDLADWCLTGDLIACDDLWYESPVGTEWEAIGGTCGGLVPDGSFAGFCEDL